MKDPLDQGTAELFEVGTQEKRPVGRPTKYETDEERKAARAAAARARRAAERAEGIKERRIKVRVVEKPEPVTSDIIDLSHLPEHRRK